MNPAVAALSGARAFHSLKPLTSPPLRGGEGLDLSTSSIRARDRQLERGAASRRRDLLLAAALVGTRVLPQPAGLAVGVGTSMLTSITGAAAMRDGLTAWRPHEVVDGAAHLVTGIMAGVAGICGPTAAGNQAVINGFSILGMKQMIDHPVSTPWELGAEAVSLTCDAARAVTPPSHGPKPLPANAPALPHRGWESSICDIE